MATQFTTIEIKPYGNYKIEFGEYMSNRNTSVVLYSTEVPSDFIKLSLNPTEVLPKNQFVVKNYSENIGIPDQVFKCGLFKNTGKTYRMPFGGECPIWEIKD